MSERFVGMKSSFRGAIRKFFRPRLPERGDRLWFEHPEMQARIAKAEADRKEGRVSRGSSWTELQAHLDSLK